MSIWPRLIVLARLASRFTMESAATRSGSLATQCAGPVCDAMTVGSRCSRFARTANRSLAASLSMPTVRKSSYVGREVMRSSPWPVLVRWGGRGFGFA